MRLVAFGDTHIKPSGRSVTLEDVELPAGTDAIVVIGDVVHRMDADSLEAGRSFIRRLAAFDVPVYSVPGNHDPYPDHAELTDGVANADTLYRTVTSVGDSNLVGWGRDQFDAGPEITCRAFESLDPRGRATDRRHAVDQCASRLEEALVAYATGDLSSSDLESSLEIRPGERPTFRDQLEAFDEAYTTLTDLLTESPTVLLTHVPPYGTELDRHHSIGTREADLEQLHLGSIALTATLRIHQPAVTISGHSHTPGYEILTTGGHRVHMLNLGFQGVVTLQYSAEGFSYGRHS